MLFRTSSLAFSSLPSHVLFAHVQSPRSLQRNSFPENRSKKGFESRTSAKRLRKNIVLSNDDRKSTICFNASTCGRHKGALRFFQGHKTAAKDLFDDEENFANEQTSGADCNIKVILPLMARGIAASYVGH